MPLVLEKAVGARAHVARHPVLSSSPVATDDRKIQIASVGVVPARDPAYRKATAETLSHSSPWLSIAPRTLPDAANPPGRRDRWRALRGWIRQPDGWPDRNLDPSVRRWQAMLHSRERPRRRSLSRRIGGSDQAAPSSLRALAKARPVRHREEVRASGRCRPASDRPSAAAGATPANGLAKSMG